MDVRSFMAEKSLVNDVAEIEGAAAAVVVVAPAELDEDELDFDDELQAARPAAVRTATDNAPARLTENFITMEPPWVSFRSSSHYGHTR
jgi:hypothetical protein